MKNLCLLGATGSIGENCCDIVDRFPEQFTLRYLSAHANIDVLYALAQKYRPRVAALSGSEANADWQQRFRRLGVELACGAEALVAIAGASDYDLLVNAIVGAAGLRPTLAALQQGKSVALANKETLVMAGELVTAQARAHNAHIFPIDSEHSAIWQCLVGENERDIERLILTASGGPFRDLPAERFNEVTVEQALKHPNWAMGRKITIDSATLMNKGLEVIEAFWLFRIPVERIQVLIHPQSIIHSMVEFVDGSIKAQLGLPDMRLPIQYALSYPQRLPNDLPRMDFQRFSTLTFFEPEYDKFRALALAFQSLREGGTTPAVLNAANEVAVHAFLERRIRFHEIPHRVDAALQAHRNHRDVSLDAVIAADAWARQHVRLSIEGRS